MAANKIIMSPSDWDGVRERLLAAKSSHCSIGDLARDTGITWKPSSRLALVQLREFLKCDFDSLQRSVHFSAKPTLNKFLRMLQSLDKEEQEWAALADVDIGFGYTPPPKPKLESNPEKQQEEDLPGSKTTEAREEDKASEVEVDAPEPSAKELEADAGRKAVSLKSEDDTSSVPEIKAPEPERDDSAESEEDDSVEASLKEEKLDESGEASAQDMPGEDKAKDRTSRPAESKAAEIKIKKRPKLVKAKKPTSEATPKKEFEKAPVATVESSKKVVLTPKLAHHDFPIHLMQIESRVVNFLSERGILTVGNLRSFLGSIHDIDATFGKSIEKSMMETLVFIRQLALAENADEIKALLPLDYASINAARALGATVSLVPSEQLPYLHAALTDEIDAILGDSPRVKKLVMRLRERFLRQLDLILKAYVEVDDCFDQAMKKKSKKLKIADATIPEDKSEILLAAYVAIISRRQKREDAILNH